MRPLAIIGLGSGWRRAPWTKSGWDRWSLNAGWYRFGAKRTIRCTAWFELHSRRYLREEWDGDEAHFQALAALPFPVYVQQPRGWQLQHPVRFARHALARQAPNGDYHASSIDWMLYFALIAGYEDIHIYGVNFGPTEGAEPLSARACMEYWIGYGRGLGRKITVHEPTGMFWIYNYAKTKTPYHIDDTWRLIERRRG